VLVIGTGPSWMTTNLQQNRSGNGHGYEWFMFDLDVVRGKAGILNNFPEQDMFQQLR